jgi:hypothetical protein
LVIERASASKFVLFFVIFIFISGSAKAPPIPILIRRHGHARYFSKRVPKISTAGRSARFTACMHDKDKVLGIRFLVPLCQCFPPSDTRYTRSALNF